MDLSHVELRYSLLEVSIDCLLDDIILSFHVLAEPLMGGFNCVDHLSTISVVVPRGVGEVGVCRLFVSQDFIEKFGEVVIEILVKMNAWVVRHNCSLLVKPLGNDE